MEKPKFRSKNHEIIAKFLNAESHKSDKNFWPREMKIASKLIASYPFEFFIKIKEPFITKIPSLAWFLTKDGEGFVDAQFFEYKKSKIDLSCKKQEVVLSPDKVGEDVIIEQRPKTLKDFLKKYG